MTKKLPTEIGELWSSFPDTFPKESEIFRKAFEIVSKMETIDEVRVAFCVLAWISGELGEALGINLIPFVIGTTLSILSGKAAPSQSEIASMALMALGKPI
jgi:hypothetical protein